MKVDLSGVPDADLEYARRAASGRSGWEWWARALDYETARRQGGFPPAAIEVDPPTDSRSWAGAAAGLRDRFKKNGYDALADVMEAAAADMLHAYHGAVADTRKLDALYRLDLDSDDAEWTATV